MKVLIFEIFTFQPTDRQGPPIGLAPLVEETVTEVADNRLQSSV
jgi:hypothetical protein